MYCKYILYNKSNKKEYNTNIKKRKGILYDYKIKIKLIEVFTIKINIVLTL